MSDVILRKSVQTRIALAHMQEALAAYARSLAARVTSEQTGQDLVEYAGILFLVALIIGAIGVTGLGNTVGTDIKNWVNSVLNGSGQH